MNARGPGPLGEEDVPLGEDDVPLAALGLGCSPSPTSPQHTDKGACTHTRSCSFSWSDDSFQFTKDSGQGSEKSGWLIRPYDFTLQRTRQKRSDTADSRGTAVGWWLSAGGCDMWDRHGTRFQPFHANRVNGW